MAVEDLGSAYARLSFTLPILLRLEFLCWDPRSPSKLCLSAASMPMQLSAPSTRASYSGNWQMLQILGEFMASAGWLVKVLVFDNHQSHNHLRSAIHGDWISIQPEDVEDVPWFGELTYENFPGLGLLKLFAVDISRPFFVIKPSMIHILYKMKTSKHRLEFLLFVVGWV